LKIITYILSLVLGAYVYFMFAVYMTASAGLNSITPIISAGLATVIFGFLSWFHFYKPKMGAILLTFTFIIMYLTWPFFLMLEYFNSSEYTPSPFEFLIPLVLGIGIIYNVWQGKDLKLNKCIKFSLATPPSLIAIYIIRYIVMNLIR